MSAELTALQTLASDFNGGVFRLSPEDLAIFFWTSNYLEARRNWIRRSDPYDTVSDSDWDTLEAMVASALGAIKVPILGLITAYATEDPPPNVLPCDGASYLRVDYPELYAVLDPFFIVDADHFSVPDLRGRTVIGAGIATGLTTRAVGNMGGEEDHTLTVDEMPSHSHSDNGHSHTIPSTTTTLFVAPGEVPGLIPVPIVPSFTGTSYADLTSTGGDDPHNNMQPWYALNYGIIAA